MKKLNVNWFYLKIGLILLVLSNTSSWAFQGNTKTDSLEIILKSAEGEEKIKLLQTLSKELKFKDKVKALSFANDGLNISGLSSKDRGIFYMNIAVIHGIGGDHRLSDEFCKKAIKEFKKADNLRMEASCRAILGINSKQRADYEQALDQLSQAYEIFNSASDTLNMIKCKGNIANIYIETRQFQKAQDNYQQVLDFAEKTNNKGFLGISAGNLATIYNNDGEYVKAVEMYSKALRIHNELGNTPNYSNVLNSIGVLLQRLRMFEHAILTLKKVERTELELGNDLHLANALVNLGASYLHLGQLDSAYHYLSRSIEVFDKAESPFKSSALSSLAIYHLQKEELDKASAFISDAYRLALDKKQEEDLILAGEVMGQIAMARDSLDKAEKLLLESHEKWKDLDEKFRVYYSSLSLSELYEKKSDFQNALKYQKISKVLEDSLFNRDQSMAIARMLIGNQIVDSNEVSLLQKTTQLPPSRTSNIWRPIIIAILLGLLFLGFAFVSIRKRRKQFSNQLKELETNNQSLAHELKQKNLELSYLTLTSMQKSEFLEKQQLGIKALSQNYPEDKKVRQLLHAYHFQNVIEKDWDNFRSVFEKIVPDFFQRLADNSKSSLSLKEIRHCALIRLNITPEDAATLLGISVKSIHKARYRLRKKLDLESKESLEEFIRAL